VQPGLQVLGDRYELDDLIASGGMGEVWRGRDRLLGRQVAVKLLRSEYTGDPTFLARFRAEATHAAALSHPNIAAVYDYGEADADGEHVAFLVMELVEGEPLSTRLREDGPLSPDETLSVLRQTAVALAEAHHVGLVHRDVKPGNILVAADDQVKITDFGIAWSAGSVPLTQAGQVLGTPQYLSPELAVGGSPSPASDVYSLGLVGYECLTGQPAFTGENPVAVALKQVHEEPAPLPDDLPSGIRDLVDVAVAKDPGERMADGDAFVAALDRVAAGQPLEEGAATRPGAVVAVPPSVGPAGGRAGRLPAARGGSRRGRRGALLAVAALLIGVGGVVGVELTADDGAPAADATSQDGPIVLDPADYVGRPVEDVVTELAALGLTVDQQRQFVPGAEPGEVVQLDAMGQQLRPGDAVTVHVADAAAPGEVPGSGADAGTVGAAVGVPETAGGREGGAGVPAPSAAGPLEGRSGNTAGDPGASGAAGGTATGTTATGTTDTGTTETGATESAPAEPAPTGTTPTEPAPTEPAPTETAPTGTAPTGTDATAGSTAG